MKKINPTKVEIGKAPIQVCGSDQSNDAYEVLVWQLFVFFHDTWYIIHTIYLFRDKMLLLLGPKTFAERRKWEHYASTDERARAPRAERHPATSHVEVHNATVDDKVEATKAPMQGCRPK